MDLAEYILYAYPVGALAEQLAVYFAASRARFGPNTAHSYMPHVTLTGFFHDTPAAAEVYRAALATTLTQAASPLDPVLRCTGMLLGPEFHGLTYTGEWLRALVADFATLAVSPTRTDALRLKDWLHLSLAYGFALDQHAGLAELARELVDITAPVSWELRLYERRAGAWVLHGAWALD